MSDNTETDPTQPEVSSSEQLVGFVPIQADEQNQIGVHLIGEADEDFFGSQAIELNGERHVIVSQAQDPETGELLLVLRGENGEHIAIQPEALSSMVQASGGDHIQVAVESTEAALTIASDISSLSQSVSSELTSSATTLSALPSIIASIPSQTQTTAAPTNVVQAIDTPRVSQEEQPSSLTNATEPVTTTADKSESSTTPTIDDISASVTTEETTKAMTEPKNIETVSNKTTDESFPIEAIKTKEMKEIDCTKKEETPDSTTESKKDSDVSTTEEVKSQEKETNVFEEKADISEIKTIAETSDTENKLETTEPNESSKQMDVSLAKESVINVANSTPSAFEATNGLPAITPSEGQTSTLPLESVQTTASDNSEAIVSSIETTPILTPSVTSSDSKIEKSGKTVSDSTSDIGFANTAVIQVQDSNTDASLEQLMANAVLTSDGNYVLMAQTEDGHVTGLPPELNLSDVINAGAGGGQTFLIETPEGLVACTAAPSGEDGAIQLIPAEPGDIENAVISSAQSGGVENQIIQAISGGQAMSYTINSATGCLELAPVSATQTSTVSSTSKSGRGNRNTRPSKPKVIPAVPSGQTLLLTADSSVTESPTVSTKPVTTSSARNRNTNSRNKGRTMGTIDSSINSTKDSTIAANIEQIKSNVRSAPEAKSVPLTSSVSADMSVPPGPSQLAASRRTYSKKSNIVWITPDASQGANTTAFATVATASVKPANASQPQKQKVSNPSFTKTTVQTTSTLSPAKSTAPKPVTAVQSPSLPSKITLSSVSATSPAQAKTTLVQSTPTASTPKSSEIKSGTKSASEKNEMPVSAPDKTKGLAPKIIGTSPTTKTIGSPAGTKTVTASKTSVTMKTGSQSNASKAQTQNLMIESSISKGEILTKTPIRMSDIRSPKAVSSAMIPKTTATKTVVTVGSVKEKTSVTKTTAGKTSETPPSKTLVTLQSASKASSAAKPPLVSNPKQTSNVSTKPVVSSAKSTPTTAPVPEKESINEKVKPVTGGVQKAIDSLKSDTSDNKNKLPDKSKKIAEKTVSTRHSARLSPSKSTKSAHISQPQKETEIKVNDSQKETQSKAEETETPKEKSEATKEDKELKQNDISAVEASLQPQESVDKVDKEPKVDTYEANKSLRKSRRSSRNAIIVEETKKELKPLEENKSTETKDSIDAKEVKETKEQEKNKDSKEKIKEKTITEPVSTRRTSGRQRATKDVAPEEKIMTQKSAPEKSLSEKSAPEKSVPEKIAPEKIAPEKSAPEKSAPEKSAPEKSASEKSASEKSASEKSASEKSASEKSAPEMSTPDKNIPDKSVPEKTVAEKILGKETDESVIAVTNTNVPQTEPPPRANSETPTQEVKSSRVTRASSNKKLEPKAAKSEDQVTKTAEPKSKKEELEKVSEPEKKNEAKASKSEEPTTDKAIVEKPKTEESNETTATSETPSVTRSVKKKVQFSEVKEKVEEKEKLSEDKLDKTKELTPVTTRRSLRSSTPQTANQTKNDVDSSLVENEETDDSPETKINNNDMNANKTPQRVSTRKRKEPIKSVEPEVKATKTPKKTPKKTEVIVDQKTNDDTNAETLTPGRLRDRKPSKLVKKVGSHETQPNSIDGSETLTRSPRNQSFIQSYINENEWQEKEADLRRKTISSLSDLRSPSECYDYSTNECSFYIRHQSSSVSTKQSAGNYLCQKCGFHTTRINNLVIHHKDQCSYIKNAVIQQWQSVQAELQAKRGRPADPSQTDSGTSEAKKRRTDELNHMDKQTDESELESEDERHEDMANNADKPNQTPTMSDIDAMLMASDDEDLLSIDNMENPKREFGFADDDIVWVETNNTHWPGLVSKLLSKEKKALIRLIDSPWPKKSLKVNISSISPFDSAEVNKQYLRDGPKSSTGDHLVKAVQKAEEFLRKKCLGSEVSAAMFFDSESDTNVEDDERLTSIANEGAAKEPSNAVKEPNVENSGNVSIESNGDDLEIDKMPESSEAVAQWKEKRRQQNAKLLQCIKDGKVETHLLGVYRGTIASERHQKFLSGSESEKNQLKHVPWFGPIDDEEQQEEIYDYCSQLFKSNFKTDGNFDTVAYIFEVWVPEAIVKAISRVRRIELKDSESIFAKGVILSKSEKDELTKEIQKEAEKQMTSQTTSE